MKNKNTLQAGLGAVSRCDYIYTWRESPVSQLRSDRPLQLILSQMNSLFFLFRLWPLAWSQLPAFPMSNFPESMLVHRQRGRCTFLSLNRLAFIWIYGVRRTKTTLVHLCPVRLLTEVFSCEGLLIPGLVWPFRNVFVSNVFKLRDVSSKLRELS